MHYYEGNAVVEDYTNGWFLDMLANQYFLVLGSYSDSMKAGGPLDYWFWLFFLVATYFS